MEEALAVHRLQFAFTATFHYIFPQLTMGLALLIFIMKTVALRTHDDAWNRAARFWAKIFGISFALGVVTGIPMEFQFGTNWSGFSKAAGGVIGQTLGMEGVFSFFLESSFLGLFLFGEKRLGRVGHWFSSLMMFLGSWLSGYLIIATDAWMQHPVGYLVDANGQYGLASFWSLLLNPWALLQYAHNMLGSVQTGCFVMASVGAFYLLGRRYEKFGKLFVRTAVIAGVIAACLQLWPTGDGQGKMVARYQPPALAAMEGLFHTQQGAPVAILGQPDLSKRTLDNPLMVPRALSFLTYRSWAAQVRGLDSFSQSDWPDQVALLYFSYHIMVGLGTIFIAILLIAAWKLFRHKLYDSRAMLWILMLSLPLPFIANTAGWITAETGRQPWLIYGLMRTPQGVSPQVSAGNTWFTLLGFFGTYTVLAILFLYLVYLEIEHGPGEESPGPSSSVPDQSAAQAGGGN